MSQAKRVAAIMQQRGVPTTADEILGQFPDLTRSQLRQAMRHAAARGYLELVERRRIPGTVRDVIGVYRFVSVKPPKQKERMKVTRPAAVASVWDYAQRAGASA
jgi:hypothetical protein